ncbi:MAG: prenyltransferase/squalene oxidase repeat-containing protein [Candidatus Thorarchaeota archaeon]
MQLPRIINFKGQRGLVGYRICVEERVPALIDLEKTSAFIKGLEDEILTARMSAIVENRKPSRQLLEKIELLRKSDGGFAFWEQDVSSITSTLNVVGWLDDFSLRAGSLVERTFDFLLEHQREDGGWDEIEEIRDFEPPPYMMPGELNTRTWLTAFCAHWFIRFGRAEPLGTKGCPAKFLMRHVKPSGLISGYLYASWDALVMFNYHPGPESEEFRKLLSGVRRHFKPTEHDGADFAWLLRCLRDIGLNKKDELVSRATSILEELQEPNGSWASQEGEEFIGMTTLDVIRVLHDFENL